MLADKKADGGNGLYILSDTVTSPTLAAQWKRRRRIIPTRSGCSRTRSTATRRYAASKAAFGDYYDAQYRLDGRRRHRFARRRFSLRHHPSRLSRLAGDYASGASWRERAIEMNRLYAVESTPTTTGFKAEHRLAMRAERGAAFAAALAAAVGAGRSSAVGLHLDRPRSRSFSPPLAADLKANAGKSRGHPRRAAVARRCIWPRLPSTRRWAMSARRSSTPRP